MNIVLSKREQQELDEATAKDMTNLWARCDVEESHIEADEILCTILEQCGFTKTVAAFRQLSKWYA